MHAHVLLHEEENLHGFKKVQALRGRTLISTKGTIMEIRKVPFLFIAFHRS